MNFFLRPLFPLMCLGVACAMAPSSSFAQTEDLRLTGSARDAQRWNFFLREQQIDQLWQAVSNEEYPSQFAIENASLISMTDNQVVDNQIIVVDEGIITAVGTSKEISIPGGILRMDAGGQYVLPGLTDMHVHNLVSNSQQLLNLAHGVTSVRDMSGFRWMLSMRQQIDDGRLLGPTMYITGHILNEMPMEFYATVVTTQEAARAAVRNQASAGYDFIKIHNVMSSEVFAAVHDEAAKVGLDVVGHVPHDITVTEAVNTGMRTLEHFKGYILDSSLTLSDEDYVTATQGRMIWNTPTFHTYRAQLRGEAVRKLVLDSVEANYVSPEMLHDWQQLAAQPADRLTEMRANIFELSKQIFKDLQTIDARFLAGTDSGGGTPFMVPGFALHDELAVMQNNGLSPFQTLETATSEPAAAMRRQDEMGSIEVGKRADLILVSKNPLDTVENLKEIQGVSVQGRWLDRKSLDRILNGITEIYADDKNPPLDQMPTLGEIDSMITTMKTRRGKGFVYRDFDLEELAQLLFKSGYSQRANSVLSLQLR